MALVLGTGFLLGLTSNIASSYLIERSPRWPWLLGSALLTLLLPAVFIWLVFSRGYSAQSVFQIALPFRVTDREAEIVMARPYPVTHLLRERFYAILTEGPNRAMFIGDWRQALKDEKRPFQGFARRSVKDLLVYAVLDALREYCRQTLTVKWVFSGQRWRTNRLSAKELNESDWPEFLRKNLCFSGKGSPPFEVIRIPESFSLVVEEQKSAEGYDQVIIRLESVYGSVTFTINPLAQRLRASGREGAILLKYCGVSASDANLWAAKFHIQAKAEFGGVRIFTRRFREDIFPWAEKATEFVHRHLDWQHCLEAELERMIVDLSEKVDGLVQGHRESANRAEKTAAEPN